MDESIANAQWSTSTVSPMEALAAMRQMGMPIDPDYLRQVVSLRTSPSRGASWKNVASQPYDRRAYSPQFSDDCGFRLIIRLKDRESPAFV